MRDDMMDRSFADDIREAMGSGPAPDTIDEAIRTLSAASRLAKKAADIRADSALMKAVRARVAELISDKKAGMETAND